MFKDCENGFGDICHFGALRGFKRCSSLSGMMISCFLSGWLNQPILVHPVNEYSLPRVSTPRQGDHVHHWEVGRRVPTPWQEDHDLLETPVCRVREYRQASLSQVLSWVSRIYSYLCSCKTSHRLDS